MDTDGNNQESLTDNPDAYENNPAWFTARILEE